MKFKLKTGTEIDLPTVLSVTEAIREFEAELKRLRRLKNVIEDMHNPGEDDDAEEAAAAGAKA